MSLAYKRILAIPESVCEETRCYGTQLDAFLRGETTPEAFRAYRVPMGIYEQRTTGRFMVRVRIGAGRILPAQLRQIAKLSLTYGNGFLHVTTRQDIQLHDISLTNTPSVLEGLLEVGLSTRGGGGNTVRNISACPRTGICPHERFDVGVYANATAEYFLARKSSFNLPRKYKITFSGCGTDCAFASVTDLGFFAQVKNEQRGFSVFAAGGLGRGSRVGIKLEDFVSAEDVIVVAEAIRRVFDRYGDRSDKNKARLRHVLGRVGEEIFRALYHEARTELNTEAFNVKVLPISDEPETIVRNEAPTIDTHGASAVFNEKQEGLFSIQLWLPLGEISAKDLMGVSEIADQYSIGEVRTAQTQDLYLTGVPADRVEEALTALHTLNPTLLKPNRPKIVACTGSNTCKLGLCLSQNLARAIDEEFSVRRTRFTENVPEIRISGCPNQCGGHSIAEIGLEGGARRINGRLMPHYSLFLGAQLSENGAHLAERVATVPARRIPELLAEAFEPGGDVLTRLRAQAGVFESLPEAIPEEYYYDFGAEAPFSLKERGTGECNAGVLDIVKVDIQKAKDTLKEALVTSTTPTRDEALYQAVVSATRALLVLFGVDAKRDREVFDAFELNLIVPGWVTVEARDLIAKTITWREEGAGSLTAQLDTIAKLLQRIEALFHSLDGNLKFRLEPEIPNVTASIPPSTIEHEINLVGVACPLNFVKAKIALEKIPIGATLEVLLDEGEAIRNVPASFTEQGQEVVEIKSEGPHQRLRVRRLK